MLRPPSPWMLRDTVEVHGLDDDLDAEGGPIEGDGPKLGTHQASVQNAGGGGPEERHGGLENTTDWTLLFAADPGVEATGQLIVWTHHGGEPLASPVALRSLGPADRPGGGSRRWTIAARETS